MDLPHRKDTEINSVNAFQMPELLFSHRISSHFNSLRLKLFLRGPILSARHVTCDLRCGVLKETVVGVEHLFGQQEEPFSGHAPIVKTFL